MNFGPLTKNDRKLCPMTLIFNRVRAVVKVHVPAKLHQAACSGSWVVLTEKKNSDENNTVRRYRAYSNKPLKHR